MANSEFRLHSKKFLGRRQENAQVRNGIMQFFCFRPTFGPIWTNFTCFRPTFGPLRINFTCFGQKFVQIGPKVGLKQENCIFTFWTSAFSCRRPKNFFECVSLSNCLSGCLVYLPVPYLFICLFVCLSAYVPEYICLLIGPRVRSSVCLSVGLSH